jgi:hypothetical protein
MPPQELMLKAQELDQKNIKVTESGAFDEATGMFYPAPKGELVERQIPDISRPGKVKTVKVPTQVAYQLDALRAARDPAYLDFVEQIETFPQRAAKPAEAAAPQGGGAIQPAAGQARAAEQAAPTALPSVSESAAEAERIKKQAVGREEMALEKEKLINSQIQGAQRGFQAAADTDALVKRAAAQGRNPFGILSQPGVGNAILGAVSQGISTPGGSISIPQLENQIVVATGSKGDVEDRKAVARNAAELTLAFRRMYLQGQGAISNNENDIVRSLAGTETDTPENLLRVSKLLKMRYQYEIDEQRNWVKFKKANKGANYLDFEESDDYLARRDNYDRKVAKTFGYEPSIPSEQKQAEKPAAPGKFTPDQLQNARARLKAQFKE